MDEFWTLWRLGFVVALTVLVGAFLFGCVNVDVNGYHAKGGSTGNVSCKGACP